MRGFDTGGLGYVADLDDKTAYKGKQSSCCRHEKAVTEK